jgi:hypothetical protein
LDAAGPQQCLLDRRRPRAGGELVDTTAFPQIARGRRWIGAITVDRARAASKKERRYSRPPQQAEDLVGRRRRNIVLQLQMIATLDRAGPDVAAAKMVSSLITFDAAAPEVLAPCL